MCSKSTTNASSGKVCLVCPICGKTFYRNPFQITRSARQSCCSCHCARELQYGSRIERFWERVNQTKGCWLWTGCRYVTGYGAVRVRGHDYKTHRFSWELHYGPIPIGMCVLHHCDVPLCVRPDHLFLGTPADNTHDMLVKGRHGVSALTTNQVQDIRQRYATGGITQEQLGKEYGCGAWTISKIIHRRRWNHVL